MRKLLISSFLFFSCPTFSEETNTQPTEELNIGFYNNTITFVESYQNVFSRYIDNSSDYIESLWDNFDTSEEMKNRSFGIFRLGTRFSTKGDLEPDIQLRLKFDLPNTKKNVKFFFDFDQQDFENLDNKNQVANSNNEELSGGFILEDDDIWNTKYKIGMNLHFLLNPFAKIEKSRTYTFKENNSFFLKQEVFYFKERGFGAGSYVDYVYDLDNNDYFEIYYNIQYLNNIGWEYFGDYAYFKNLDSKNSLKASIGHNQVYDDDLIQRKRHWTQIQWRSLIHKNWLYMRVIPEVSFEDQFDYKPDYRLVLQFELFFGNEKGIERGVERYR